MLNIKCKELAMTFPSTYEIIKHFNVVLITGPILLIVSVPFWVLFYLRVRHPNPSYIPRKRRRKSVQALAGALFLTMIGGGHLLIYFQVTTAFRFRFDPDDIEEIRIARFERQFTKPYWRHVGEPLVIRDTALIREGLSKLHSASSFQTEHEHFEGTAYRIVFRFWGKSQYSLRSLWLHDRTQHRNDINVIIPNIGDHGSITNQGGEYSCSEFHQWFEKEILPRMVVSDTRAK